MVRSLSEYNNSKEKNVKSVARPIRFPISRSLKYCSNKKFSDGKYIKKISRTDDGNIFIPDFNLMEKLKQKWYSPELSEDEIGQHTLCNILACYVAKYGDLFLPNSLVCQKPDGELAPLGLLLLKLKLTYDIYKPDDFNFIKNFVELGLLCLDIDRSELDWVVMSSHLYRHQFLYPERKCNVPYDYVFYEIFCRYRYVGEWLNEQRVKYAKGTLRRDRRLLLDELVKRGVLNLNTDGVRQRKQEVKWSMMFQHLLHYEAECGHCNVPNDYILTASDNSVIELGKWLDTQRQKHSSGHLKPDWKRRLQVKVTENKLLWNNNNNNNNNNYVK